MATQNMNSNKIEFCTTNENGKVTRHVRKNDKMTLCNVSFDGDRSVSRVDRACLKCADRIRVPGCDVYHQLEEGVVVQHVGDCRALNRREIAIPHTATLAEPDRICMCRSCNANVGYLSTADVTHCIVGGVALCNADEVRGCEEAAYPLPPVGIPVCAKCYYLGLDVTAKAISADVVKVFPRSGVRYHKLYGQCEYAQKNKVGCIIALSDKGNYTPCKICYPERVMTPLERALRDGIAKQTLGMPTEALLEYGVHYSHCGFSMLRMISEAAFQDAVRDARMSGIVGACPIEFLEKHYQLTLYSGDRIVGVYGNKYGRKAMIYFNPHSRAIHTAVFVQEHLSLTLEQERQVKEACGPVRHVDCFQKGYVVCGFPPTRLKPVLRVVAIAFAAYSLFLFAVVLGFALDSRSETIHSTAKAFSSMCYDVLKSLPKETQDEIIPNLQVTSAIFHGALGQVTEAVQLASVVVARTKQLANILVYKLLNDYSSLLRMIIAYSVVTPMHLLNSIIVIVLSDSCTNGLLGSLVLTSPWVHVFMFAVYLCWLHRSVVRGIALGCTFVTMAKTAAIPLLIAFLPNAALVLACSAILTDCCGFSYVALRHHYKRIILWIVLFGPWRTATLLATQRFIYCVGPLPHLDAAFLSVFGLYVDRSCQNGLMLIVAIVASCIKPSDEKKFARIIAEQYRNNMLSVTQLTELFERRPRVEPFVHAIIEQERTAYQEVCDDVPAVHAAVQVADQFTPQIETLERSTQAEAPEHRAAAVQVEASSSTTGTVEESDVYQHFWSNTDDFKYSVVSGHADGQMIFELKDPDMAAEVACRIPFIEAQVRAEKTRLFFMREECSRVELFTQWREGYLALVRGLSSSRPARSVILKRIVDLIDIVPCTRTRMALCNALDIFNDRTAVIDEIIAEENQQRQSIDDENMRLFSLLGARYAKYETTKYNQLQSVVERQKSIITKLLNRLKQQTAADSRRKGVRFSEEAQTQEESEALEVLCPWIVEWEERQEEEAEKWHQVPTLDDLLEDPHVRKMHDDAMRKVEDRFLATFDLYGDTPVLDWGIAVEEDEDEVDYELGMCRDGVGDGPVSAAEMDLYHASMNGVARHQRRREESRVSLPDPQCNRVSPNNVHEESKNGSKLAYQPGNTTYPIPLVFKLHFLQTAQSKYGIDSDEMKKARLVAAFDDKVIFSGSSPNVGIIKATMGAAPATVLSLLTQAAPCDLDCLVPVTKMLNELNFEATYYQVLQLACGVKNQLYQLLLQSERQVTKKSVVCMPVTVFGKIVRAMKEKEDRVVRPTAKRGLVSVGAAPLIQGPGRTTLLTARSGAVSSDVVTQTPETAGVTAKFYSAREESGGIADSKTRFQSSHACQTEGTRVLSKAENLTPPLREVIENRCVGKPVSTQTAETKPQIVESTNHDAQDDPATRKTKRKSKKNKTDTKGKGGKSQEVQNVGTKDEASTVVEEAMVKAHQYVPIPRTAYTEVTSNGRTAAATATYLSRTLEGSDTHLIMAFPLHEGDDKRLDTGAVKVKFLTPIFGLERKEYSGILEPARVGGNPIKQVGHLIVNIGTTSKLIPEGSKPRLTDALFEAGQRVRIYTHVDVNGSLCEVTDDGELTSPHELGFVHSCNTRGEGASGSPLVIVGGPFNGALIGFTVLGSPAGNVMARYTTCTPTTIKGGVVREKTL